ncbi:hypothetical protein [Streptosporangium sp. NPDC051022]|uniref:hypothetical protein n=1 Tax=Streptosporangium sp. NPDC051022 TaxID=3155752 RepID=UPI003433D65B
MPAWAEPYFTPAELTLPAALRWMMLLFQRTGWEPSRKSVAQRIYIATAFKKKGQDKKSWHSEGTMARHLDMSRQTVNAATQQLAAEGWVVKVPRPGRASEFWPSWPPVDCLTPNDGPERCAMPTKAKTLCTRRAGWGTATPGVGPCVRHGGPPPVQPDDTPQEDDQEVVDPETCPTVGQVGVQPDDIHLSNGTTPLSSGWTRVHQEDISAIHHRVDAGVSPYGAEVEVPQPRSESEINEETSAVEKEHARLGEAVETVMRLTSCSRADAMAMVRLIDQEKAVTDWPRYLASFTPGDLAGWQARVRPVSTPPPAQTVLAGTPHVEPSGDTVPAAQSVAALRARMKWHTFPSSTTTT